MSDYDPAETNDGDVTSWKPLTTIWPSSSGFGSSFGLDGPSLVASDPGCGLEIDSAVKCQPAAGTTWWEQGRLGKGVYSGYTAVRILPLTCPESFSTVVTSIKDQCCRV